MGGATAILLTGFGTHIQYPREDGPRGLIALAILGIGLVSVVAAHLIDSGYAMKMDPRIRFTDVILLWFTIWQPSIGQLPESRHQIWGISWGLTTSITGVLIIGGIDYSAPFRTTNEKKP